LYNDGVKENFDKSKQVAKSVTPASSRPASSRRSSRRTSVADSVQSSNPQGAGANTLPDTNSPVSTSTDPSANRVGLMGAPDRPSPRLQQSRPHPGPSPCDASFTSPSSTKRGRDTLDDSDGETRAPKRARPDTNIATLFQRRETLEDPVDNWELVNLPEYADCPAVPASLPLRVLPSTRHPDSNMFLPTNNALLPVDDFWEQQFWRLASLVKELRPLPGGWTESSKKRSFKCVKQLTIALDRPDDPRPVFLGRRRAQSV